DGRRDGGQVGERGERVQVAPVRPLGVVGRDRDVIDHPEIGDGGERIGRARRRDQRLARRLRPHVAQDDAQLHRSPVRAPPCSVNGIRFLFLGGGGGGRERKRSGGGGGPAATFEGAARCAGWARAACRRPSGSAGAAPAAPPRRD